MTLRLVNWSPDAEPELRGDPLDEMYARYAADVKRWARRLAGPKADVEDLLHDVFVIALRRRFISRGEASAKTWLFRITHHVVRGRMRRGLLRGLLFRRRRDELLDTTLPPATPHEEVERRERHERLYRALDRLPDCYRTALILYEIEGLTGDEIAELTGVSVGTMWVRLHRGRTKLLECLTRDGER
jgi:RNA polymerase sigma-70 factor, ECF subfamily